MSHDLQMLFVGAAATIDTALLLSLLERRNWRHVPLPVVLLFVGTCCFHWGEFANLLLAEARGGWSEPATVFAMFVLSTGLLLLPSALIHLVARLWQTGIALRPQMSWHFAFAYSPLLLLPWIVRSLQAHPNDAYLVRVTSYVFPYVVGACAVNAIAIATLLAQRRLNYHPELQRFMKWMALLLGGVSGLLIVSAWSARIRPADASSPLIMATILSPIALTVMFAYYVIRYRLLKLVLERTLVYGAILLAVILFHRLILGGPTAHLRERYQIDFGILEGIIVLLLVLGYQPFRQRVSEALHYLMKRDASDVRDRTRRLAVEMWERFDNEPQFLLDWFLVSIRKLFDVKQTAAWLFYGDGSTFLRAGEIPGFSDEQAKQIRDALPSQSFACVQLYSADQIAAVDLLQQLDASVAVRLDYAGVSGVLVIGRRSRAREFGEEEINAVVLLAELLAVILHNRYLQSQKLSAERVAVQHEKLSTIGMLTTCLAHEIKNPLSSIKTIATLMAEQFGDDHPHAEDVRLILAEVQRLSTTTADFLRFARPSMPDKGSVSIYPVIDGTLRILASLARSKGVVVEATFQDNLPEIAANETTLREIILNLLLNSIEAADRGNHVHIDISQAGRFVIARINDDGPGISPDVQQNLFSPFVTTKPTGTGLGLYIVRRNVEHLGGEITCDSVPGKATCFCVKLPCEIPSTP